MAFDRRYLGLVLLLFLLTFGTQAREWPFDGGNLVDSFASSDDGRFRRGLTFKGNGERIGVWAAGELIWVSDPGTAGEVFSDRGVVAVEHSDGFRTVYRGIDVIPSLSELTAAGNLLSGETLGYAGTDPWLFEVSDTVLSQNVDPLSLLPLRENLKPPRVVDVSLVRGDDTRVLKDSMELPSGRWTITFTPGASPGEYAVPTDISVYWVGERVAQLRFDALIETGDGIGLETPQIKNYTDIYDSSGRLIIGEVMASAGRGILELRFKDETGRVSSRSWRLMIIGD